MHDPKLKYVTSVKKVNVACFNSFPVKCSSTIVMVSATACTHISLPAIRHSGTKTHATAMQTGFLHSQTKWDYFCHWNYSRQAFMLCLSPAQAHIALLYIQGKKKKSNYNKNRSQLPAFTYRAEGSLIIHIIHSFTERVFMQGEINCLLTVV